MIRFVIYDFLLEFVRQFTVKLSCFFISDLSKFNLILSDLIGL
jgi:hypothetical protein